jgi:hypothetical protein
MTILICILRNNFLANSNRDSLIVSHIKHTTRNLLLETHTGDIPISHLNDEAQQNSYNHDFEKE